MADVEEQTKKALEKITRLERDVKLKEGVLERTQLTVKAQKKELKLAERRLRHAIEHADQPELEFAEKEEKKKGRKGRPSKR